MPDQTFTKRQMAALAMTRRDRDKENAKPGCNHDNTGEYDCRHQPCILCMGPWNRNK